MRGALCAGAAQFRYRTAKSRSPLCVSTYTTRAVCGACAAQRTIALPRRACGRCFVGTSAEKKCGMSQIRGPCRSRWRRVAGRPAHGIGSAKGPHGVETGSAWLGVDAAASAPHARRVEKTLLGVGGWTAVLRGEIAVSPSDTTKKLHPVGRAVSPWNRKS